MTRTYVIVLSATAHTPNARGSETASGRQKTVHVVPRLQDNFCAFELQSLSSNVNEETIFNV